MAEQSKAVNKHSSYSETHSQSLPNLPPQHLLISQESGRTLRILPGSQGAAAEAESAAEVSGLFPLGRAAQRPALWVRTLPFQRQLEQEWECEGERSGRVKVFKE